MIENPTVNDLPVREIKPIEEYVDSAEGTTVSAAAKGDDVTAHIMIRTQEGDSTLNLLIQPQVGRAYAIKKSEEGHRIYDPDNSVGTYVCQSGYACKVCGCGDTGCSQCTYEVYCCDGYCYWGDKVKVACCTGCCAAVDCCQKCNQCDPCGF